MRKTWSIFVLILITHQLSAQDEREKALLHDQISRFGQADIEFTYPGRDELKIISSRISVYNVIDKIVKASVAANDTAWLTDFPVLFRVIERSDAKAVESALSVVDAMNWNLYPTYPQYDTIMHRLAAEYPMLCRVDTIGWSIGGRLILSLKISDNVMQEEQEPQVFYSSTIHGDELLGYVLMLRLAEHLLENSANGSIEQQLVDSLEIYINPLANPDGTYFGGDTISFPIRRNLNGIDLNRNFPDPTASISPQPENIAMIDYLLKHRFVLSANFHSGAEVLNFPWDKTEDWSDGKHADSTWFFKICKEYVDTVHHYAVPGYLDSYYGTSPYRGVVRGDDWYSVIGSRQDYVTYERQGREVTIELSDIKETPASQLNDFWEYNYRSLTTYLSGAFYGIHGRVIDDANENPIKAMIFVRGHDRDSSQVFSDTVSGFFTRLLDEGVWDIIVSAEGYETRYIDQVDVFDHEQTFLEIRLSPGSSGIIDYDEDKLYIWPIPADDLLHIKLAAGFGSEVLVSIFNLMGSELISSIKFPGGDFQIESNISSIPPGIYILRVEDLRSKKSVSGRFIKR